MDTARYKAFAQAADTGSITRAAEVLNYTPSGVSQLIHALEKDLDITLLHRTKRGVSLTEEGRLILPAVRDLLRQEDAIEQMAENIHGLDTGIVRITAYYSIAAQWLPKVIREFRNNYPGIEIQIIEGIAHENKELLDQKKVDLAFMSYVEPMPYTWIPLKEDPMVAVLPKDHPLACEKRYPLAECEKEQFIMPAQGLDDDVNHMAEKNGLTIEPAIRTEENTTAISMIEQGLGMSIMNELITEKLAYDVVKLPVEPPCSIELGIAIDSPDSAPPAVKKFVDYAVDMLGKQ